ncbi:MAG TPA: DUF1836 domain-containing protein [Candidatus Fournierella merdigallinarum]|nr:DUF1836 domain-containing protein [Candidatus Fournierella merdigallinarum]
MKQGFQNSEQAAQMLRFHCPRWEQLPGIALYMDQVTGYLNEVFAPLCPPGEEKTLTKAMVNNYVKLRVMEPPVSKKYGRTHVAQLLVICALKQVFSIPEVARMIRMQAQECELQRAYDFFCDQLEAALEQAATGQPPIPVAADDAQLVAHATRAVASKIYLQKRLEFEDEPV